MRLHREVRLSHRDPFGATHENKSINNKSSVTDAFPGAPALQMQLMTVGRQMLVIVVFNNLLTFDYGYYG